MYQFNEISQYVIKLVNQTNQNVFLTGKAGSGKTTLLKEIIRTTHKKTVVVAPTAIAALNAEGVTIHSQFQLPPWSFIPDYVLPTISNPSIKFENKNTIINNKEYRLSSAKYKVIQNMQLLVIDEVSMLRSDLLDALDCKLKYLRRNNKPYGGVQVLFVGDLLQLPPIVKQEEWAVLKKYYQSEFFYDAQILKQVPPILIELTQIYRQSDPVFLSILENIREHKLLTNDAQILSKYIKTNINFNDYKGYIVLTTHNNKAEVINQSSLKNINAPTFEYQAEIIGDFPDKIYPIDKTLTLKVGAQIMCTKNDISFEKKYFNGKIGFIQLLTQDEIFIRFPDNNNGTNIDLIIEMEKYVWKNIRYTLNEKTQIIEEEVLGTFEQYPIKLAYSITVHKSQGLTFDKAILDISQVFAPGQLYVALSRLRSLDGLILLNQIQTNGLQTNKSIVSYYENKVSNDSLEIILQDKTYSFLIEQIETAFNWDKLLEIWYKYLESYSSTNEEVKSNLQLHLNWVIEQKNILETVVNFARKFLLQINKTAKQDLNLIYLQTRSKAAIEYFLPFLEKIHFNILFKMEEVKKLKRMKSFFQELIVLEESQNKTIIELLKIVQIINNISEGKNCTKEFILTDKIIEYKNNKLAEVITEFKKQLSPLDEEAYIEKSYYGDVVKRRERRPKSEKSTYDLTFELWQQKLSIQEIATQRKLAISTIEGHLVRFVVNKQIKLADIIAPELIATLIPILLENKDKTIGQIREMFENKYTFGELKLVQAGLHSVI